MPAKRERVRRRKAIVVGTDLSSASSDALARAADIARETGATVHVVHASRRLPAALARTFGIRDERCIARALDEVATKLAARGARVRTHHAHGAATNALRATSREADAALVVVGARGRAVPDATIGSTAERIAATERTPVLLVRRKVSGPYRDVVVAAAPETDVLEATHAARLVAPEARLSVLHAYTTPFESRLRLEGAGAAELRAYRKAARDEAEALMAPLVAAAGLDESVLDLEAGDARRVLGHVDDRALVVLDRGRSALRHAFLGSVSRWVIGYGASDVLLV